jgi:branched-chain amino acid transport system substrate-binding protein
MKKIFIVLLAAIILVPSAARCQEERSGKTLKIGAVLSLTGDAAMSGDAMRKGIELASSELREKGWDVEVTFQDGETKPAKSISSFQYLINNGYKFFIGPTWSFEINSVKPLLEKNKVTTIAPAGSSDINSGASSSIFNLCPLRSRQVPVLTEWLIAKRFKKAYILVPSGDWGIIHRTVYVEALKNAGIELVGADEYDYGLSPSTLKSLLLKRKVSGADLIVTTGAAGDIANMLKIRSEMHWDAGFITTEALWDAIDSKLLSPVQSELKNAWVLGLPLVGSFFDKFTRSFQEAPKVYADRGYDALILFAQFVEASANKNESPAEYFLDKYEYTGASGVISFNPNGDRVTGDYRVMEAFDNKSRV